MKGKPVGLKKKKPHLFLRILLCSYEHSPHLSSGCRFSWRYNINKDRDIAAAVVGFSENLWHTAVMFQKSPWHLHFQRLLSKSGKIKDKAERKVNECSILIWETLQCLWSVSAERVWASPLAWVSNGDEVHFLSLLGLLFFNNLPTSFLVLYSILLPVYQDSISKSSTPCCAVV